MDGTGVGVKIALGYAVLCLLNVYLWPISYSVISLRMQTESNTFHIYWITHLCIVLYIA